MVDISTVMPVGTVVTSPDLPLPAGGFSAGSIAFPCIYSALFGIIGTTYGSLDSTLFSLPDCRGRVTAGVDAGSGRIGDTNPVLGPGVMNGGGLGNTGGLYYHYLDVNQMPAHAHNFNDIYQTQAGGGGQIQFGNDIHFVTTSNPNATAFAGGRGAQQPPPTILLQKIIKF
jgi:microcystin-dependent protein